MQYESRLAHLSDDDLLRRLVSLLQDSRRVEADLAAHIGEVDERRLYAREASPSMFAYCTEVLHLSEAEAYLRIAAARAGREHPAILEMLGDGRLHLSGIAKLVPHLTPENGAALLARASHLTKRQIKELIAEVAPRPDVPTLVRKLPGTVIRPAESRSADSRPTLALSGAAESASQLGAPPQLRPDGVGSTVTSAVAPVVEPLAPARYKVQFTAGAELRDKLERLQKLMRVESSDLAAVIEQAVTEKLERLERRRFAVTKSPRRGPSRKAAAASRYITAAVRRAVYRRDGSQCRFVDVQGRRCPERHRLDRGRDAGFPAPPAQIRACAASALGSCLR